MLDLFNELELIADPVIKHYRNDFYVHDRALIEGMRAGDIFLWAPRELGTHLVVVQRRFKPNVRAREHYEAVVSTQSKPIDWYTLSVGPVDWSFAACEDPGHLIDDTSQPGIGGETVSEVHL